MNRLFLLLFLIILVGCPPVDVHSTRNKALTDWQGKTIERAYVESTGAGYKTVFVFTDGTQLFIWNYKYSPSINKEGF